MALPHSRTVRPRGGGDLRVAVAERFFGYRTYNTAALPRRLYSDLPPEERPEPYRLHDDARGFEALPSPLESVARGAQGDSTGALRRLQAAWLLAEDRYHRLDVQDFVPLPHQLSLVEHLCSEPNLRRVLVADEVGLGKTIETALILRRLGEGRRVPLRVLYLTEARLVENVTIEFRRVGLPCRRWSAEVRDATLAPEVDEGIVVASIHRAVARPEHVETIERSGPWDVLVVDEAHHLTDWSEDGGDPQMRMRLVRRLLANRLRPYGRLLLLTGTPHQGHADRFRNVLKLLDEKLEDESRAAGRVIYRIKEDITGWDGQPLFPPRQVDPPTIVPTPPEYRRWLDGVGRLLAPSGEARTQVWRQAQALEWCASSPEAGLAYLVRMARRTGLTVRSFPPLNRALAALRPYRGGSPEEPLGELEERIASAGDDYEEAGPLDRKLFEKVIDLGTALVAGDAVGVKVGKILEWMTEAPGEKFVVFAQPVDTVHLLQRRLDRALGRDSVSLVIGGQTADERRAEIARFRETRQCRVLVSSRSGGEGINLQVARHLVHFDVPWNPMDLEQRVGRVHRYGGFRTVHVRTLVMEGTREERVLQRCRARLGQIARDINLERIDLLFARTMSMVPADELARLMMGEDLGPLRPAEEDRLDHLVQEGFRQWKQADSLFRTLSSTLPQLQQGCVVDDDLAAFLSGSPGFERVSGWTSSTGEHAARDKGNLPVDVFRLPDGTTGTTSHQPTLQIEGPKGEPGPEPVGLNHPSVVASLRKAVFPEWARTASARELGLGAGGAVVERAAWSAWLSAYQLDSVWSQGALVCAYLVTTYSGETLVDDSCRLSCWLVDEDGDGQVELSNAAMAALVRLVRDSPGSAVPTVTAPENHLRLEAERLASMIDDSRQEERCATVPLVFLELKVI